MSDFDKINALVNDYYRILHEGDVDGIKRVFLPECNLVCPGADGTVMHMTLEKYISIVEGRETPKSLGHPIYGRLVSFDQSGPNTALVKIDCAVQPRYFTDYLSLIKTAGEWRIAAKVYMVRENGPDQL